MDADPNTNFTVTLQHAKPESNQLRRYEKIL